MTTGRIWIQWTLCDGRPFITRLPQAIIRGQEDAWVPEYECQLEPCI